jgi:hypothetical protein
MSLGRASMRKLRRRSDSAIWPPDRSARYGPLPAKVFANISRLDGATVDASRS